MTGRGGGGRWSESSKYNIYCPYQDASSGLGGSSRPLRCFQILRAVFHRCLSSGRALSKILIGTKVDWRIKRPLIDWKCSLIDRKGPLMNQTVFLIIERWLWWIKREDPEAKLSENRITDQRVFCQNKFFDNLLKDNFWIFVTWGYFSLIFRSGLVKMYANEAVRLRNGTTTKNISRYHFFVDSMNNFSTKKPR